MAQINRKSSSMNIVDRALRRAQIRSKRHEMISSHRRAGRYYVQYHTTTFGKRQSHRANVRYAALPDGAMHKLPLGHIVNSNDFKRKGALKHLITSEKVFIEPKPARKSRAKKVA